MTDTCQKLSPTEFLEELKNKRPGAAAAANASEDLDLDFSDLETDSGAAETGQSDAAEGADGDAEGNGEAHDLNIPGAPAELNTNAHLSDLFERVNQLLGGPRLGPGDPFRPLAPETLEDAGLTFEEVERLILKFLLSKGSATGRQIAVQICLPFHIVEPILRQLKQEQLVHFKSAAEMGDYEFAITEHGRERARRYAAECTYFGAAPVPLRDYLKAMETQSITKQQASEEELREAFSDLIISEQMLEKLGPAINSGRGMFLYGEPGNGKTSIAERITRCFGTSIWIPRCLGIDGDIIRIYDPGMHELVHQPTTRDSILDLSGVDQRWVNVLRPTVIAGGELTMSELEVTQNPQTRICEGPLQLKSNCGTLVIDDFGRQIMPVDVLLNRWIVPLEKRYDFLNLPSGKKIQVPFDQLIIFSTNLEPKDLVDGAFLRRIPYKIEVADPSKEQFLKLFEVMCPSMGFTYEAGPIDYLIQTHYEGAGRAFRCCHPRDLLQQVRNYCTYKRETRKLSNEAFDFAVSNYFSVM